LALKAGLLNDAATDEKASEFMGHLYEFALEFVLQYEEILQDDPDLINLAVNASRGLGGTSYAAGTDILWEVFLTCKETVTKVEALKSLSLLGKGNAAVVNNLNQYLIDQNSMFAAGIQPDYPVLSACISALGELADEASFPVLFSAMISGYSNNITNETAQALSLLEGDYKAFLVNVIQNNPPSEKIAAFNAGLSTAKFTSDDLGEIAETALSITLEPLFSNINDEEDLTELRHASVKQLTAIRWIKALDLAIKNFYLVQEEISTGKTEKERLIEAIQFLGIMESPAAAQNLALYLGLLNSQMERTGQFDEAITTATIQVLGDMGDKISFDYLLYVSYLSYPETIQTAAKEALEKLKW
jgi:HEAT repeat protein